MFPQGGPGLALVLLRASVLASFVATTARHPGVTYSPLVAGVVLVSLCLAAGFMVPVISLIVAVAAVADLLMGMPAAGFRGRWVLPPGAAGVGLVGPGAFSGDGGVFGRRVTVLPAPADRADD